MDANAACVLMKRVAESTDAAHSQPTICRLIELTSGL